MSALAVRTYEYLPKQAEFMIAVDKYPRTAYIGGVGSGKTHILCLQALREMAVPNSSGLIGAPTYKMLQDVTIKKFFELCPPQWIEKYSITRNALTLTNGSECLFRSFDNPDSLQGHNLDWFGGDEMGLVGVDSFKQMEARLRKPGGRHKGFIVGNPSGPTHWTYDYFVLKAQDHPDTYKLVQATSYENAFLPESYTGEMEKSYGKDTLYYKRFVMGQFVAFEGAYWPNFLVQPYPDGHILPSTIEAIEKVLKPRSEVNWSFGRSLDFGFEHPWVLMWWVHDGHTIVFYDEYYRRHATIKEHLLEIKKREHDHLRIFGVHKSMVTWTDHDAQDRYEIENCLDDEGRPLGFTCSPTEKKVIEGILCVQALIERNRLYITDKCVNSRIEIPSYRAKPSDKTHKEEPIKEKDDTCDTIRYACWMEMRGVMEFLRAQPAKEAPPQHVDFTRVTPSTMTDAFAGYGADLLK